MTKTMTINEALSNLHGINVAIDLYVQGKEKIDLYKLSDQLMEARKALEIVRVKK